MLLLSQSEQLAADRGGSWEFLVFLLMCVKQKGSLRR